MVLPLPVERLFRYCGSIFRHSRYALPSSKGRCLNLAAHPSIELTKYELLDEIGHGGMATVFRARDPRLNREVAVKVIHRHLRESPEVAARFRSEALAVAKIKHPNIVEVYDVSGEDELDKYLVVELIRGMTLRQLLLEQGPLPPEIAACIGVEVARALAAAHREGIVHRDIKPENVLLRTAVEHDKSSGGESARVKLTDFGIAKLLDAQGVTHTGQVLGSPAHMAPEQIEGGDVDARADVFGAGVLLYEMLTGVLPFEGKNPAQVLRKVLEGVFLPAERQLPRVGSAYGKIANRALSHSPADRFATATEMADALETALSDVGAHDVRTEIERYLEAPED
jgi:serine/threonine-protein kinase